MADGESSDGMSEAEVLGMAISSFSMRVEYARTHLKGLMTPPHELLGRIRWLFLLGAVTIAAASAPLLVISPDMGEPYLLAGGTALALLSYGCVHQYLRGSTSLPREAVQVLLLVVFGLTVGPDDVTTLFYISLCFFNLYGGTV
jgi:hypothetical protein